MLCLRGIVKTIGTIDRLTIYNISDARRNCSVRVVIACHGILELLVTLLVNSLSGPLFAVDNFTAYHLNKHVLFLFVLICFYVVCSSFKLLL